MNQTIERVNHRDFDIETRRYNDTVTWLAEVMPGSMRTPFEYRFDGRDLYAGDNGALSEIFNDSIEQAKDLPAYELRRRLIEKEEYLDMLKMMRGELPNTMVVVSDFPPELMNSRVDVGGYNAKRKQTMLRILVKTSDNKMSMYSQSLDLSDRQALENIYLDMGFVPNGGELLGQRMNVSLGELEQRLLTDRLTAVYDRSLSQRLGGSWQAGIRGCNSSNTYDFVCQQQDLLNAYLATSTRFTGGFKDYSLAAAMKDRFLGVNKKVSYSISSATIGNVDAISMALAEMGNSGNRAQARGDTFSGCGATLNSNKNIDSEFQLQELGYGNRASKSSSAESLKWKKGVCRIDNCPTRPGKTEVAQCSVCRGCQAHFDKGIDPKKIYRVVKTIQPKSVRILWNGSDSTAEERALAWLN